MGPQKGFISTFVTLVVWVGDSFVSRVPKSRHGGPGCEAEMREALDKIKTIAKRENRDDTFILSFILGEIIGDEKPAKQIFSSFLQVRF